MIHFNSLKTLLIVFDLDFVEKITSSLNSISIFGGADFLHVSCIRGRVAKKKKKPLLALLTYTHNVAQSVSVTHRDAYF